MKIKNISTFGILLFAQLTMAQLTVKITAVPANTPTLDGIHIAGNFQNWNPGDAAFKMTKNEDGTYETSMNPPVGKVEFKFARGNWDSVETTTEGSHLQNRVFNYQGGKQYLEVRIDNWADLKDGFKKLGSTASANVAVFDNDYYISQLNRKRRILIYLPPDYATSGKRYPVLYMQDAQNVFDATTSFSGEWQVDETLNRLAKEGDYGCIVVAIDNGEAARISEYTPWVNAKYGGGEGDEYLDFVANELKAKIDKMYRTLPQRETTGIMGSSLGGLISHYGLIKYQDIFSKAGVFSPAFWINKDSIYTHTIVTEKRQLMKVYLLAGQREDGGSVVRDVQGMASALRQSGFSEKEILVDIDADGEHSEWYWAREFEGAYKWLFGGLDLSKVPRPMPKVINIHTNLMNDILVIDNFEKLDNPRFEIIGLDGKPFINKTLESNVISIKNYADGTYVVNIYENNVLTRAEIVIFGAGGMNW
ncbi:MAG: putative alpha/beta superfamily hydrolase [Paraglaciecola sp.]|jgi:predicted alpha/beta superfamily hydrolase